MIYVRDNYVLLVQIASLIRTSIIYDKENDDNDKLKLEITNIVKIYLENNVLISVKFLTTKEKKNIANLIAELSTLELSSIPFSKKKLYEIFSIPIQDGYNLNIYRNNITNQYLYISEECKNIHVANIFVNEGYLLILIARYLNKNSEKNIYKLDNFSDIIYHIYKIILNQYENIDDSRFILLNNFIKKNNKNLLNLKFINNDFQYFDLEINQLFKIKKNKFLLLYFSQKNNYNYDKEKEIIGYSIDNFIPKNSISKIEAVLPVYSLNNNITSNFGILYSPIIISDKIKSANIFLNFFCNYLELHPICNIYKYDFLYREFKIKEISAEYFSKQIDLYISGFKLIKKESIDYKNLLYNLLNNSKNHKFNSGENISEIIKNKIINYLDEEIKGFLCNSCSKLQNILNKFSIKQLIFILNRKENISEALHYIDSGYSISSLNIFYSKKDEDLNIKKILFNSLVQNVCKTFYNFIKKNKNNLTKEDLYNILDMAYQDITMIQNKINNNVEIKNNKLNLLLFAYDDEECYDNKYIIYSSDALLDLYKICEYSLIINSQEKISGFFGSKNQFDFTKTTYTDNAITLIYELQNTLKNLINLGYYCNNYQLDKSSIKLNFILFRLINNYRFLNIKMFNYKISNQKSYKFNKINIYLKNKFKLIISSFPQLINNYPSFKDIKTGNIFYWRSENNIDKSLYINKYLINKYVKIIDHNCDYIFVANNFSTRILMKFFFSYINLDNYKLIDKKESNFIYLLIIPKIEKNIYSNDHLNNNLIIGYLGLTATPDLLAMTYACFKKKDLFNYYYKYENKKLIINSLQDLQNSDVYKKIYQNYLIEEINIFKISDPKKILFYSIIKLIENLPEDKNLNLCDNFTRIYEFLIFISINDYTTCLLLLRPFILEISGILIKYKLITYNDYISYDTNKVVHINQILKFTTLNETKLNNNIYSAFFTANSGMDANLIAISIPLILHKLKEDEDLNISLDFAQYYEVKYIFNIFKIKYFCDNKDALIHLITAGFIGDWQYGSIGNIQINDYIKSIYQHSSNSIQIQHHTIIIDITTASYKDLILNDYSKDLIYRGYLSIIFWESDLKFNQLSSEQTHGGNCRAFLSKEYYNIDKLKIWENDVQNDSELPSVQLLAYLKFAIGDILPIFREIHFTNAKKLRDDDITNNLFCFSSNENYNAIYPEKVDMKNFVLFLNKLNKIFYRQSFGHAFTTISNIFLEDMSFMTRIAIGTEKYLHKLYKYHNDYHAIYNATEILVFLKDNLNLQEENSFKNNIEICEAYIGKYMLYLADNKNNFKLVDEIRDNLKKIIKYIKKLKKNFTNDEYDEFQSIFEYFIYPTLSFSSKNILESICKIKA